jgi:hypothetical protein
MHAHKKKGVLLWLMGGKKEPAKLAQTGKRCLPQHPGAPAAEINYIAFSIT